MSFLRVNTSIAGVVVTEFDSEFSNTHFEGHDDDATNMDAASIAATAMVVARALHKLAQGSSTTSALPVWFTLCALHLLLLYCQNRVLVRATCRALVACHVQDLACLPDSHNQAVVCLVAERCIVKKGAQGHAVCGRRWMRRKCEVP